METFTRPGSQDRELMICRVRAGLDPVLVKINTTLGEEQSKDDAVSPGKVLTMYHKE